MSQTHTESDRAAGREILDGFLARLEALGLGVAERTDPVTRHADADVTLAGRPLCRIQFSTFEGRYTLNVLPPDPASITLLCQALGRVHVTEAAYTASELDHVEALMRTALVREGRLPEREFATDYALRSWVAANSTIRLPHERAPRRSRMEGVSFRPGELPDESDRSTSPASKALVQACRLLDVDFDRGRAIDIARAAASSVVVPGGDKALSRLAFSARILLRGRMRDMEIAWDRGGLDRALVLHGAERDDMRVPLALTEESPAPRLW